METLFQGEGVGHFSLNSDRYPEMRRLFPPGQSSSLASKGATFPIMIAAFRGLQCFLLTFSRAARSDE
jgi:hypothetical protein